MYYKIRLRIVILILPPNKNTKGVFGWGENRENEK